MANAAHSANPAHIESLVEKHAYLQAVIDEETHRPLPDAARLAKLKRQKLRLKEEISRLNP